MVDLLDGGWADVLRPVTRSCRRRKMKLAGRSGAVG